MSFPWTAFVLALLVVASLYAGARIRRSRAAHRARSEERAAQLMRAINSPHATHRAATAGTPAARGTDARPRHAPLAAHAATTQLMRKPRLLTEPQRSLYLLLRSALPDHVVMANIRLADLVEPAPEQAARTAHETRMRELLQERADCLVCDQDLVPLAAVVIYETATDKAPDERVKVEALRELGIRFLRFRADDLPRPAEMRTLILG